MTLQNLNSSLPATVEIVDLEEVVSRESLYISRKGRVSDTGKDFYLYLASFMLHLICFNHIWKGYTACMSTRLEQKRGKILKSVVLHKKGSNRWDKKCREKLANT